MLVVVAVLIIGLAVGVPQFARLVKNNALSASSNEFVQALSLARSEAVKRLKSVTVCKSNDQTGCTTNGDWSQGWIAFVDNNGNGSVNPGDTVVLVHDALPSGQSFAGSNGAANALTYTSSGKIKSAGSLKLCDDRSGNFGKSISVSVTGRVRLSTGVSCP